MFDLVADHRKHRRRRLPAAAAVMTPAPLAPACQLSRLQYVQRACSQQAHAEQRSQQQ